MKSILLVAILLFVLADVHSISTRRNRVERQAPTETGDGDNETDDDDNDDDDDEEDPPEAPDTLHAGQQNPQQETKVNQNIWTNKRVDSKKITNVATNIQNKPGISTKPAVTSPRTHWSRNQNHHKTHRQTNRQAHRQTHRQTKHQAHHQTYNQNQRQVQHQTRHQTHRQAKHQTHRQPHRQTNRQVQHKAHRQNYRQTQRQVHRQTHRQANRQTLRQVHRQNHYKSHMRPKHNPHSHYQTKQQSPIASKDGKISGNFAQGKTFRKQTSNVRQTSNIDLGGKFRTENSLKVNTVSNTKQTQGTINHKTTNHNRHRNHNLRKNAAQVKHQTTHRQRSFNWGNRGLNIRQPQQTLTPVTLKPTLAPSVTRSWDHVTRQVSPQPTYTTPSPPVHRQNPKFSVVNNRWNRNRSGNSNYNTGPSYATSKEVKQSFSKTITNPNSENKAQNKVNPTLAKSPRWQQPNNRFNNNQRKTKIQNRNYWHNQRKQQSTSGRFVSHRHRAYSNNNVAKISPVSDTRATQYPVRKEFIALSVEQSRTPDKAMPTAIHSPAVLSSPTSNTDKSPSVQLSNVIYPQHVSNVQRNSQGSRNKNIKSGKNIWNGVSNTGVTWSGTSTFNSGSSANKINVRANSWNTPTPSVSAFGKQVAGQEKQTESSSKIWKIQPSISSSLSTSSGRLKPQQTQMDLPNSPKLVSHINQKSDHQVDPTTQPVYKTNVNGQPKDQMLTDSSVSKSSLVDSLTASSVSSGSSKTNEWSSQPKYQNRMPTIKNHIGWASESGSINQQASTQPASTVSSSSSPNSIPSNTWSSTLDNKRQHQHHQGKEQQQQQQKMHQTLQLDHQHQQKQLQSSADKHAWMTTSVVSAVQETPNVVQAVITPTVAFESEPAGHLPLETVSDSRSHQQSAVSSSTKTMVPISSSASSASYVPNEKFNKHVENKATASSINHDIPIPSFEAMGLTRQPTDSWTAPNNVELSSKSLGRIPSQNIHTNPPNTVPNTLARHLIRESVTEHHTQTKIEEQPKLKKEAVNEKPTSSRGSNLDQVSLFRLTTKKPLFIGSDSKPTIQRQTHVSQTVDSPKQTIAQGVDKVSRVTAKGSKDIGLYAPTLTINGGKTEKSRKIKQVDTITASNSPPSRESHKQQPQTIQGTKEVGSTKVTGSLTGNNNNNGKGTEQLRKQTVIASSVNNMYNDRDSGLTRHSSDTSSRTSSTSASGRKSPSTVTGTSQLTTSGKHYQSNSVSSVSSLSHPKTVNNNFLNFETTASIPNKISTSSMWAKTSSPDKQGQQSNPASGKFVVNNQNENIAPSLSQPQGISSSGIFSISDKNKVNKSFSKNNSEKKDTIRSDVTGTKDNTALLSQQSMVLHHNIDVIQSGTSNINQGGASLSTVTGDVNRGSTKANSVTESETRQSQNTVYKSPSVIQQQQSGNRVVEPHQGIPYQLKQSILQPMSFIDSVNKEMAALSAQNTIPVVNQVRKDRVYVSRRNEWDRIVPSIPDILASMGRPKLSFGVDPGHTVHAIKRVHSKAKANEVTPVYNIKHKESKQSGPSALDVALGRTNNAVLGKQNKKLLEANKKSEKSENSSKPGVPFIEYNTIERRQSQRDPIKEVQVMYNQLDGTLPIVGEAPFNVGLPGDQVYTPTSSRDHYQPVKESLAAGPKTLAQDSLLVDTTVSPLSPNVLYHGPLYQGKMEKTSVNSRKGISKPKESFGLHSRNKEQNENLAISSVIKTDITQKGIDLIDAKPLQKDTTAVSSSALSSPVKDTTRSVGMLPSTTVATTIVPAFSTRKITTSHNVLLERLFDYAALVTTTPTPVNRNKEIVYRQMQKGPFMEGQKVIQQDKDARRPTPLNQNSVVDYTKVIGRPSMENNQITDSVKEKWRPSFSLNTNNILVNRGSRPKLTGSMNSLTTDSQSQSLVSFSNTQRSSLFSSSHSEVRKVDVPGWNADYSVADSLSGFGKVDLKLQSNTDISRSSSLAGESGKGNNRNEAVSVVKDTTMTGSSNQAATVKPIVSGKIGKSFTEEVVTGDTGRINTSDGNIPLNPYGATSKASAASSLISPPEVNVISGDSSSISLMAHNALEYGIETTTKESVEQPKSAEKPETSGSKQKKFPIPQTTGKGNIDRKTENFQSAGQNPNEFFPGRMKFQRHNKMGFYSLQADSKRKQDSNGLGKINSNVKTSFASVRPNSYVSRPPPPSMFHSRGMTSHPTAGRIHGKYSFVTG